MIDVVVIGLGPAGTVAAHVLAAAGLRVTALQPDPPAGRRGALISPPPTVRRTASEDAVPAPSAQLGADRRGGSKHLAAPQSYRLTEWTLGARTATLGRYGAAAIATDADLVDWPLGLHDLQPYYELVERAMGVTNRPGSEWTDRMASAALQAGWAPFAAPAARDVDVSSLLEGAEVDVVPATALAIDTDSRGEVRGVGYVSDEGAAGFLRCRAVVLGGSVIPTIRLLLLSGIGAGGQVGRYFSAHNMFAVHGWFPGRDLQRERAGPATAVAIGEFEDDRFDHAGLGFVGGSILQAAMSGPRTSAWHSEVAGAVTAAIAGSRPDTSADRSWVASNAASMGAVWAQPDQLPRWSNAIDLDPVATDQAGRPVARLTLDLAEDDHRRWEFLADRMSEWLRVAGAARTWVAPLQPQPLGSHLYGGARMGTDPQDSVVDAFGRCHTVPGLVIVGTSTFPSTGGRGPVETVEALAWRSAARLAEQLR